MPGLLGAHWRGDTTLDEGAVELNLMVTLGAAERKAVAAAAAAYGAFLELPAAVTTR